MKWIIDIVYESLIALVTAEQEGLGEEPITLSNFQMDFGKDEVSVSSTITALLYYFLLRINTAAGRETITTLV